MSALLVVAVLGRTVVAAAAAELAPSAGAGTQQVAMQLGPLATLATV
eukprot:COSAG03_NODE_17333_length_378_cov_0.745520_1_plen_46_part_10